MNHEKHWTVGRLAKIGLTAAAVPTLLVGLVAFEQTDTGPATVTDSELVGHINPANGGEAGNKPDVDEKENDDDDDDKDQENPANGGVSGNKPDVDKKENRDPSGVLIP